MGGKSANSTRGSSFRTLAHSGTSRQVRSNVLIVVWNDCVEAQLKYFIPMPFLPVNSFAHVGAGSLGWD